MQIVTPEAILSYPSVFTPNTRYVNDGDAPKYEATFVFPAGTDLTALKKAVMAVGQEKFGDKFTNGVKNGSIRLPFRTDWEEKRYPEDSVFFTARSNNPPGLVSVFPDPDRPDRPARITDESQLYPGAKVKALLSVFAYSNKQKGVTFGLEGIQKVGDGERLDGRANVQDVFDVDESAFASFDAPISSDEPEAATTGDDGEAEDILGILGG